MLQANGLEAGNAYSDFLYPLESNRIDVAQAKRLYTETWDSDTLNEEVALLFEAVAYNTNAIKTQG